MEFSKICRICLGAKKQMVDIFTSYYMKKSMLYLDMLSSCTKIKPSLSDGLPKNICKECVRQLRKTYAFNVKCEDSDRKLRNFQDIKPNIDLFISNQQLPTAEIVDNKQELRVKSEDLDPEDTNQESKNSAIIPVLNIEQTFNDAIKFEEGCVDDENGDFWDAEDDSLLEDIKSKKYSQENINVEYPKKKRRKKKDYHDDESIPLPNSKLPHQCDICGKFLSNKSNLKAHKICHTDIRPFKCESCPASFRGHSALFQHKKIHTGEKCYHCEYCPKQFSRRTGLVNHIRIHTGEKLYSCEICFKAFVQNSQLAVHMRRHNGDKPYLCQECGKGFPIKADLTVHQRIHNGEKPYHCPLCPKTFATSGNLNIHVRIHNKDIRFKCKECQRGFVSRSTYNVHLKRHKGQRDYQCECGKTFYTTSALKQHKVVHTGEKKYQCKICERKFTQTSHLSRHFKRDHAKPNAPIPSSEYYKIILRDNYNNVFNESNVSDLPEPQNINSRVKCENHPKVDASAS